MDRLVDAPRILASNIQGKIEDVTITALAFGEFEAVAWLVFCREASDAFRIGEAKPIYALIVVSSCKQLCPRLCDFPDDGEIARIQILVLIDK